MTTTDIEKVDLQSAADKLKERIQLAFVDLLTPEQWKKMIEQELQAFTVGKTVSDGYRGTRELPSKLHELCVPVFTEVIKEKLQKDFTFDVKEEVKAITQKWLEENSRRMLSDAIMMLISEAMDKALSEHLSGALSGLQNLGREI